MLSHACRAFAGFVLGASIASVTVAQSLDTSGRSILVSSTGSTSREWIRIDLSETSGVAPKWVIEPGSNSGAMHRLAKESSVLQRLKFRVSAIEDGFAPLMRWESLWIGLSHQSDSWTLWVTQEDDNWKATDFQIEGSLNNEWINLDLVKTSRESLVFLNGSLAATLPASTSSRKAPDGVGELTYFQLPFAQVEIAELAESTAYPSYVVKALRQMGLPEPEIATALNAPLEEVEGVRQRRQPRDDNERRLMAHYPDFRVDVFAGDLSFDEEAWFLTRTLNRSYYEYRSGFDLAKGPERADELVLIGADYLPTPEGRSWTRPIRHSGWGDYYIQQIRGYIVPPVDGEYRFWISGDEQAALFVDPTGTELSLELVAQLNAPVARRTWADAGRSKSLKLAAGKPVYIELWHLEQEGDDHIAIGWTTPEEAEPVIIPSAVVSSHAAGIPGSYPRRLYPRDPSLLGAAVRSIRPEETQLEFLATHSNGQLLGNVPLASSDFLGSNNRYHAYQGNGYGLVYSTISLYPDLWSDSYNTWLYYEPATSNPQQFYHYDVDIWASYWGNCGGTDCGVLQFYTDQKPLYTTFESEAYGRWAEAADGDTINWILDSNGTLTPSTGPNYDNTEGSSSGRYLYFETSIGYAYTWNSTADLLAPPVAIGPAGSSLTLFYHMYGTNIGSLAVQQRINGTWQTIWSKSGQQQPQQSDKYRRADVSLAGKPGDIAWIKIRATAAGGDRGDIAIDDIAIYDNGVDTDGDGMTDGWEWKIFQSFNTYVPGDSDGDGLPNMAEYILGANPAATTQKNGSGAPSLLIF